MFIPLIHFLLNIRFYSSPFIVAMSTYCMLLLIARVAYKSEHSYATPFLFFLTVLIPMKS